MKNKLIILLTIFTCFTPLCIAEIDIVYPQTNMTTDVYYATSTNQEYTAITNNSIPDAEYTHIILQNKISDTNNLIDEPEVIFDSLSGIFYLVVFVFVLLLIAHTLKRVLL
jgi:hypothetical protein